MTQDAGKSPAPTLRPEHHSIAISPTCPTGLTSPTKREQWTRWTLWTGCGRPGMTRKNLRVPRDVLQVRLSAKKNAARENGMTAEKSKRNDVRVVKGCGREGLI